MKIQIIKTIFYCKIFLKLKSEFKYTRRKETDTLFSLQMIHNKYLFNRRLKKYFDIKIDILIMIFLK